MSENPSIGEVKKGLKPVHEEAGKAVASAEQAYESAAEAQISGQLCLEAIEEARRHASEMLGHAATALAANGNTTTHTQSARERLARYILGTNQTQTGEESLRSAHESQKSVGAILRATIGTFPESSIGLHHPEAIMRHIVSELERAKGYAEESRDAVIRGEDEVFVTDENL